MSGSIIYDNSKRFECPVCHVRALAKIIEFEGRNVRGEGYSYCYMCRTKNFPDAPARSSKEKYCPKPKPEVRSTGKEPDLKLLQSVYDYSMNMVRESGLFKYAMRFIDPVMLERHFLQNCTGSDACGACIFWTLDRDGRPLKPKSILYDSTKGKRMKGEFSTGASVLVGRKRYNFSINNGYDCHRLFGQEKLSWRVKYSIRDNAEIDFSEAPVLIVESEKSALIASIEFPDYLLVASGGASGMTHEKTKNLLHEIGKRKIFVCYDADRSGVEGSQRVLDTIRKLGGFARILNFRDIYPSALDGYDFADVIFSDYEDELTETRMIYNTIDSGVNL